MRAHNDHLTLLPEAERQALYDRPEFDDFQRADTLPSPLTNWLSRSAAAG